MTDAWGETWGGNGGGPGRSPADADRLFRLLLRAAERAGPGVGERVGEFDLLETLAPGKMGRVMRARRTRDGHDALVHLLPAGSPRSRRLFEECQAAIAAVADPRLLPILEAGETPRGETWCACGLAIGRGMVRWCRESAARLETRLSLLGGLAAAIAGLHGAGVVHGELSEETVLVDDRDGRPRLRIAPWPTVNLATAAAGAEDGSGSVPEPYRQDLQAIAAIARRALADGDDPRDGATPERDATLPWRLGRELRRLLPQAAAGQGSAASLAAAFSRRLGGEVASE